MCKGRGNLLRIRPMLRLPSRSPAVTAVCGVFPAAFLPSSRLESAQGPQRTLLWATCSRDNGPNVAQPQHFLDPTFAQPAMSSSVMQSSLPEPNDKFLPCYDPRMFPAFDLFHQANPAALEGWNLGALLEGPSSDSDDTGNGFFPSPNGLQCTVINPLDFEPVEQCSSEAQAFYPIGGKDLGCIFPNSPLRQNGTSEQVSAGVIVDGKGLRDNTSAHCKNSAPFVEFPEMTLFPKPEDQMTAKTTPGDPKETSQTPTNHRKAANLFENNIFVVNDLHKSSILPDSMHHLPQSNNFGGAEAVEQIAAAEQVATVQTGGAKQVDAVDWIETVERVDAVEQVQAVDKVKVVDQAEASERFEAMDQVAAVTQVEATNSGEAEDHIEAVEQVNQVEYDTSAQTGAQGEIQANNLETFDPYQCKDDFLEAMLQTPSFTEEDSLIKQTNTTSGPSTSLHTFEIPSIHTMNDLLRGCDENEIPADSRNKSEKSTPILTIGVDISDMMPDPNEGQRAQTAIAPPNPAKKKSSKKRRSTKATDTSRKKKQKTNHTSPTSEGSHTSPVPTSHPGNVTSPNSPLPTCADSPLFTPNTNATNPQTASPQTDKKRTNRKRKISKREAAIAASAAKHERERTIAMLAKTKQITDEQLLRLKPKKKRRAAKFEKPTPSRFCHICSRTPKNVRLAVCNKIRDGICRKVICEKCFAMYNLGSFEKALDTSTSDWSCPHCKNKCPTRAQCRTYQRTNDRLRVTRLKQEKPRGRKKGLQNGVIAEEGSEEAGRSPKRALFLLPGPGPQDTVGVTGMGPMSQVGFGVGAVDRGVPVEGGESLVAKAVMAEVREMIARDNSREAEFAGLGEGTEVGERTEVVEGTGIGEDTAVNGTGVGENVAVNATGLGEGAAVNGQDCLDIMRGEECRDGDCEVGVTDTGGVGVEFERSFREEEADAMGWAAGLMMDTGVVGLENDDLGMEDIVRLGGVFGLGGEDEYPEAARPDEEKLGQVVSRVMNETEEAFEDLGGADSG